MKIKTFLSTIIAAFAIIFTACDDDLNSIGNNIQPEGDGIEVSTATFNITARTVSLEDRVYARTAYGLLGEYSDAILGKVKADYLTEFYCPDNHSFEAKAFAIDSVGFDVVFKSFVGDSTKAMGISIYEVTKKHLDKDFYTNIDPTNYYNPSDIIGERAFTIKDIPISSGSRVISTPMDTTSIGWRFLDEYKAKPGTFKNSDTFRDFFKGVYVTSNFGSGSLIDVDYTLLNIYYRYWGRNKSDTQDSIHTKTFRMVVTPEVLQMNHVQNKIPTDILTQGTGKSYLKTPAGVCTELSIPLSKIIEDVGTDKTINFAKLKIKGFSEEEESSGMNRPSKLLLIHKDSVATFFPKKGWNNAETSKTILIASRDKNNTYDFGNIGNFLSNYIEISKDKAAIPSTLDFWLIPVDITYTISGQTSIMTGIYNTIRPTSAVLRTDEENMKLPMSLSKYKTP